MNIAACLALLAAAVLAAPPAARAQADAGGDDALIEFYRSEAQALENGEGVERDAGRAAALYCKAARLGDAQSQFNLAWMYANGRGVERNDSTAAFFFHAAAEQGLPQAVRMLAVVGGPTREIPECMVERAPPPPAPPAVRPPGRGGPAVPAPPPWSPPPTAPKPIVDLVNRMAPEFRVQPRLALTFIETESNFNVAAVSPKNARGLMQLIPATAERFGVRNAFDATQNVRGGLAYLRWLLAYFEGDVMLVAAAYNAGEGAVDRYLGVPPYLETRNYVRRILVGHGAPTHPFDPAVTAPSPALPAIRALRRAR